MKIDVGGEGGATPPRKDLYSITTTRTPRQATASNRAAAQASSSVDGGVDRRATERGAALLNGTGDGTGGEGKKEGSGGGGAVNKRPLGRAVPLEELEQQGEEGCDDFSKDGSNTALIEVPRAAVSAYFVYLRKYLIPAMCFYSLCFYALCSVRCAWCNLLSERLAVFWSCVLLLPVDLARTIL